MASPPDISLAEIPRADLARIVAAVRGRPEPVTQVPAPSRGDPAHRLLHARLALVLFFVAAAIFLHGGSVRAWFLPPAAVAPAEEIQMNRFQVMAVTGTAAGMAALSSVGVASAQNAVQWRVEDGGNGHWYQGVIDPCDWSSARAKCLAKGGTLATLTSEAENLLVFTLSTPIWSGLNGPWLGAFQAVGSAEPGGGWQWVTGEPWNYQRWDCANPNNLGSLGSEDSLDFGVDASFCGTAPSATWNDSSARKVNPGYMIEWSADCNADGIVDYGQILDGTFADSDANNIPDCCEQGVSCAACPGDVDESGAVNSVDLAAVLANWGTDGGKYPRTDVNGDGTVDSSDLAAVLSGWGPCG